MKIINFQWKSVFETKSPGQGLFVQRDQWESHSAPYASNMQTCAGGSAAEASAIKFMIHMVHYILFSRAKLGSGVFLILHSFRNEAPTRSASRGHGNKDPHCLAPYMHANKQKRLSSCPAPTKLSAKMRRHPHTNEWCDPTLK